MSPVSLHRLAAIACLATLPATACTTPAQETAQETAQQPAHFAALAIPPSSAGTCVAAQIPAVQDSAAGELKAHHLVITSVEPGGRREMTVYTDAAGTARRYTEWTHRMTGAGMSVGESVVAVMMPDGRVSGLFMRIALSSDTPEPPTDDSTAHRARDERVKSTPARSALTSAQHAQVREIAAWLARRCPARG